MALFQQLCEVISELTVFDGEFNEDLAGLSFSSCRHGLIFDAGRDFHFLDEWGSFGFLFFGLILSEHDFTEADSLDEVFGDIADFFALNGVIEEEGVGFFFLKVVDLVDFGVDNFMKVIDDFLKVRLCIMNVDRLNFLLKNGLKGLFPLINALNTVNGENAQM